MQDASSRWRRVCELALALLDSPTGEWDHLLARECGEDVELRFEVLRVCRNYSENDELFGAPVVSSLVVEDSRGGET